MPNPICISPLKFYDSLAKQSHRKSYAYNHIAPIITKKWWIPSFQFVIPSQTYSDGGNLSIVKLYNAKTDEEVTDLSWMFINVGNFNIRIVNNYKVAMFISRKNSADYLRDITPSIPEGLYYLKLASGNGGLWTYYSEVFCFTNVTEDCIELEYWNETGNFNVKNGIIAFPSDFHFKLLLKTEIGKPEYNFEEESTKRLGYIFVESQVSKKIYKFNTIIPEYICDALRLVRLCDNKIIRYKDNEYEAMSFEMEVEWQTQGDLASVTCEFETDNIIANIGGFVPNKLGGDYNDDYDEDFAVSVTPNYEEVIVGTSQDLWQYASDIAAAFSGNYGFVCPYNGYVAGVIVDAVESYSDNIVSVFQPNAQAAANSVEIGNVSAGKHTYILPTPLQVTAGQVITFKGARFKYSMDTPGDWPTNSNHGQIMSEPYRIYRINFIFEKVLL